MLTGANHRGPQGSNPQGQDHRGFQPLGLNLDRASEMHADRLNATEGGQHCTGPQSLQTHLVYTWQHPLKPVRLAVESGGWEQATSMHLLIDGALKTGGVEPPWCVYRRTGQTPIKGLIVDRYRELGEPNRITCQKQQERLKASFMVRSQVCSASIIGRTDC